MWYKFTPSVSGIYELSTWGSTYKANISVLRYVSSTSRTPLVCSSMWNNDEETSKLAFYATGGYTYLVRASDALGGGDLDLMITRKVCPAGDLCGAAVGGDGVGGRSGCGKGNGGGTGEAREEREAKEGDHFEIGRDGESSVVAALAISPP